MEASLQPFLDDCIAPSIPYIQSTATCIAVFVLAEFKAQVLPSHSYSYVHAEQIHGLCSRKKVLSASQFFPVYIKGM